jgi:glycosyltransferase involved in cell wall biosynthesis
MKRFHNKLLEILNNKKILEIGSYPPPIGGVSIHIYRLCKNLNRCKIFDWSKKNFFGIKYIKLIICLLFYDYDIVHLHIVDKKTIKIIMFLKKIKKYKIFFTAHNPLLFDLISKNDYLFYKNFIEKLDMLIVVGEHILKEFKKKNVNLPNNILVEPAFLPPIKEDEGKILKTYPKSLFSFLKTHEPLIIANASALRFYKGVDLYGLDMCIEITKKLKNLYPDIGFIFALASINENKEYLKKMRQKIKEMGIEDNFYFLIGQKKIWPLFKKVDLMIRPTFSDGYGISVEEALFFGCPALASDVCKRPNGTIIFKNRNIEDLYKKILGIIRRNK